MAWFNTIEHDCQEHRSNLLSLRRGQNQLAPAHKFEEGDRAKARGPRGAERRNHSLKITYTMMLAHQKRRFVCAREFGQRKIRKHELEMAREKDKRWGSFRRQQRKGDRQHAGSTQ
jgi:hypothetical protein